MEKTHIESLFFCQKEHSSNVKTRSVAFRKEQLRNLKASILRHEQDIYKALYLDLKKSEQEVFFTELGLVLNEIDFFLSKLFRWSKNHSVSTPIYLLPSKSYIRYEPRGVCLIMVPFNYPFQLCLLPLIGSIGAGNCTIIKGSEKTPNTNKVLKMIIKDCFSPEYICFLEGNSELSKQLLRLKFDFIFFTGSTYVGKKVMQAAAENLTPFVLEMGGKSPCIVHSSANLRLAAKRIVWGKFINAGQTCIAPDFLVIQHCIKDLFISLIIEEIEKLFGEDASLSLHYGKIIDFEAYERIVGLIDKHKVIYGGFRRKEDLYISPTVLTCTDKTSPIAQEEIFGPLLPIWTFDNDDDLNHILLDKNPLALYVFGSPDWARSILDRFSSGGACINDVLIHISNKNLPFGGIGKSGIGSYHGYRSFLAFSHERSIVESPTWIDLIFRYPPYPFYSWIKNLFRL